MSVIRHDTVTPFFATLFRILLGILLAFSAIAKGIDMRGFRDTIGRLEILPSWLIFPAAITVIALEFLMGMMLLLKLLPDKASLGGVIVVACFTGILITEMARGSNAPCGCFGQLLERRTDWAALSENLAAAVILLSLHRYYRKERSL
ncbi:MAG: MauE/DoxX family redox-associated membrane protein [Bacteroidota bacterium]